MYNNAVNALVFLGAVIIIITSVQIIDYFAKGKTKWPVWGVIIFYLLLYAAGAFLLLNTSVDCIFGKFCQAGAIGGATLLILGYSAAAFYLFTVYSFTSLRRKMRKLNFSDKFTEKIRIQHSRAVIVFFFTTWVASGFVFLIHHRAAKIVRQVKKTSDPAERKKLESNLDEIFGRKLTWRKHKKKK